jgi:dTMP kinase
MVGKLIVIDGIDGSGKTTQTEMLISRLQENGYSCERIDFPQYGQKSAGPVEEYLNGTFGTAEEVGPYRASIFYAVDRYAAKQKMQDWLSEGKIIISNRYVSANIGHQAGKIQDSQERKKYLDWLFSLEFDIFGIPKPDLNVFLHVPPEIGQKLVEKKEIRKYIESKEQKDIHEKDLKHLSDAEKAFLEACNTLENWHKIDCTRDNKIMTPEEIHYLLWTKVQEQLS